ncbi:MAG: YlbF family regulator [Phycisphaeraceae bacterium]
MPSTEEILQAARELGNRIDQHEAARKFKDVIQRLNDDTEAQRALNDYNRHAQAIAEKEANQQPIEVEDKRRLQELQKAVIRNPLLREFQKGQMDYVDLMRRVDEAMTAQTPVGGPDAGSTATPTP